ncbi:MAG: ATP-binding protein [Myxococcales bacterium]|nr:PAS domain S-box protein [Myxococcales bacterium]
MGEPHSHDVRRLGDFLRHERGEIIARWEHEVRRLRPAEFLSRPVLLDHIPDFVDQLADFVSDSREHHDIPPPHEFPVIHALERLDLGYDLSEVVAEYAILRECITTLAQGLGSPSLLSAELPRLHKAIDSAISASVVRYHTARERTLKALDRISTAALNVKKTADGFLGETLDALLETTPAIDSASILLAEDGKLRVKAAAGLALDPGSGQCLERGECFAGTIWQTGQPALVRDAENDPRVVTDIIRRRGTHALYGAPLRIGDEVIGVALIGSSTTYEFSQEDLLLFRTAVNRVSLLVAQARKDEAIRRQTALYESVVSALGDVGEGYAVLEEQRLVVVNDALCRIVGRSAEELYALPSALDLIVPEEREGLAESAQRRLRDEIAAGERIETTVVHKDGRRVEVEIGIKPKPTGRVVVVVHDVSRQKELERQRALQAARLATVLRVLPVGVVIAEAASGRITLGNAEAERIWGRIDFPESVSESRLYEGYWSDGRPIAAGDRPMTRAIVHGETSPAQEVQVVAADGTRRTVEHRAAPIRDDRGEVVAGVVTLVDITERKGIEEELRGALAFRDQILNILAHDLRQPLSVIAACAQIMLRRGGNEQNEATLIRQLSNADRMERLIRDLLDYARAQRGQGIPIVRKHVDLHAILQLVVASMEMVQPERKFSVTWTGDCSGEFDPDRIQQVFANLLGNAVVYSPKGTPIDLEVHCDAGFVTASVHNAGDPIPADRMGTLFEPFRRGTSSANPQGLGLGLFIVERIVTSHGGKVTVRSEAGSGTTFTVRLPKKG